MTPHEQHLSARTLAPLLLVAGVGVAILAQLLPGTPMAVGVALAGWGTALALPRWRSRFLIALLIYTPLVLLAMGAEIDAARRTGSLAWQFFTAIDAGAGAALLVQMGRRCGDALRYGGPSRRG